MEALKEFLQSPDGAHIKRVFFNDKGEWCFSQNKQFQHEKSVDEILGEAKAPEGGKKVKVTQKMLKDNPELKAQGIKAGDVIEIPAEAVEDNPEVIDEQE